MAVQHTNHTPDAYYSTHLNSRIKDIDKLSERIAMTLGYPQLNIEAHQTQVYDNIAQACELFTKYAGYTEEYLVFHSSLYEMHRGVYIPKLINFTPELSGTVTSDRSVSSSAVSTTDIKILNSDQVIHRFTVDASDSKPVEYLLEFRGEYYHHATKYLITALYNDISDEIDASVAEYGASFTTELPRVSFNVRTGGDIVEIVINATLKGVATVTIHDHQQAVIDTKLETHQRGMDALLAQHRKVVDVFTFEEGSTSGINTLFTIEQTLAQQTYFSYSMGNYGFDLVSWYVLKEWLSMREKLLSQKFFWRFNDREQRLYITPEPVRERNRAEFFAAIGCYLEKPLEHVIQEVWVYQYALALTKITVARIRGKYQGTNLFGGGSPNYTELLSEGIAEKERLEESLYSNTAPGLGDAEPPKFFIG